MQYNAKDLFQDWYSQSLKKDVNSDEITLRKKSIEKILRKTDKQFWIELIRIYNGSPHVQQSSIDSFMDVFKKDDENFPLKNNNLIRILAGCAIAQKMEKSRSEISDMISLAISTSTFLHKDTSILPEIKARAEAYWIKECILVRNIDEPEIADSSESSQNTVSITAIGSNSNGPVSDYASATEVNERIKKIENNFTTLNSKSEPLIGTQQTLLDLYKTIAEETNILWWLFGAYSNKLNSPLAKLDLSTISSIVPLEIASLTKILPGITNLDNILYKGLSLGKAKVAESLDFFSAIEALSKHENIVNEVTKKSEELIEITPCTYALYYYSQFNVDDWKKGFMKSMKITHEKAISPLNYAQQLYKEQMLVDVYENLK